MTKETEKKEFIWACSSRGIRTQWQKSMAAEAGSTGLPSGTISSRQKGHETLKPQSQPPPPVIYFLQHHHTYWTSPNCATSGEPSAQMPDSMGDVLIQTTKNSSGEITSLIIWDFLPEN